MTLKGKSRMRERPRITAERLRELLRYDHETGALVWAAKAHGRSQAVIGAVAGGKNARGYVRVVVCGRVYQAHHLVWLHVHGEWPTNTIDHINGVKDDNRLANLRDVPMAINNQNKRKANGATRSGLLGAHHGGPGRSWQSSIKANGKLIYLGRFETKEQAHAAYVQAKRALHAGGTL